MRAAVRFQHETQAISQRAQSFWARRLNGVSLDVHTIAMVTLQMYHFVRHTPDDIRFARSHLGPETAHDRFRSLLDYLEEDEANHEQLALDDLRRMGFDPDACQRTLPLPTTFNLPATHRLGIERFGPYYYLGALLASETEGAEIASALLAACSRAPELPASTRFFRVHAPGTGHDSRTRACFEHYAELDEHYRSILFGFVTECRNFMLLANEIETHRSYPPQFQLPR